MAISNYNASASLNTAISGIAIGEGSPRANQNDAVRQLMADLAQLPASSGSDLVGFLQTGTGAVARTVLAKLRDTVSPADFGAVADFTGDPLTATDNYAALVATINAASLLKKRIYFSGVYYSSQAIALANKNIEWEGSAGSGLAFNATGGVAITQTNYTTPTNIYNLAFYTVGTEDGVGLSVTYSASDSITNRTLPRCFIDRIAARGWDTQAHGWTKGIYTKNVHASGIGEVWIIGRRDLAALTNRASFGNMTHGLHYDSDTGLVAIPSDALLDTVHVYNAQNGIFLSGDIEGTTVTACKLVGVWKGVVSNQNSARPGLQVHGNHINYFDVGVDVFQQPQTQVYGNLLYKFELSDGLSIGVRLLSCNLSHVGQNTHINSATNAGVSGEFDCIQIGDCVDCRVDAQVVEKASRIVKLTGTTTRCRVKAQTFAGTAFYTGSSVNSAVVDTSSGTNFIGGRWASAKSGAVTVTSGGTNVVSVSSPVNVRAGQRFKVSAIMAFTKGGTGGTLNCSIGKSAGVATIAFYQDATSMGATSRPDAGIGGNLSCQAEMTVTGDGDLQLTMTGVSLGSDTTVAAGGAQITLTEIE